MRGWLARGTDAARFAADRADLWLAGALAWLLFIGWLPLLLVIAPPDAEGIEAFGVSLYLSQAFPLNIALLAGAVVIGFAALCALAAAAELAIYHSAVPDQPRPPAGRAAMSGFTVILVCSVPVVAALGLVVGGVIAVAPSEYLSADLGTPILLRIALRLIPQLGVALAVLLVMQVIAGSALRLAYGRPARTAAASLAEALGHIRARPLPLLGVAVAGLLLDALLTGVHYGVLRILWPPIGLGLGDGLRSHPETVLLLLGFVSVWLGLLLAAGAMHVAVSAWWASEVGSRSAGAQRTARPLAESETGGAG